MDSPLDDYETDIGQLIISKVPEELQTPKRRALDRAGKGCRRSSLTKSPSTPDLNVTPPSIREKRSPMSARTPSWSGSSSQHNQNTLLRSSDLAKLPVDSAKVPKMRRWILGIALVDFDLELGPVVQGIYPPMWLESSESENIAFSSFPDSLQFDQGSQVHSFRIRDVGLSPEITFDAQNSRPPPKDGFMYGYSYFTQRRDLTSKRGYQQRSIVILTHHQYPALFSNLINKLGEAYDTHDVTILEIAFHNIAHWSDPTPGATIELGFLGSVLHVELPRTADEQQLVETSSFHEKFNPKLHILASSPALSPPPLLLFEGCLSHLWSIWECVILCEPILIFGPSPALTSQAVWWFRDLLRPLPLANDIRPYFTIHDKDHASLVNKMPPKRGLMIGVTNPFFDKSCTHWPHVLSLGRSNGNKSESLAIAGPVPGWVTKTHKRFISKDRCLLKQLEDAIGGSEKIRMEASINLRHHFSGRSAAMLVPLNRYLTTLIPSPSPPQLPPDSNQPPRLKPFNTANFLASLKTHGAPLPFKSTAKQKEFYERWLKTPAFGLWLGREEGIVQEVLRESARRASASAEQESIK